MADARVVRRQRKAAITRLLGSLRRLTVEEDELGVHHKMEQLKTSFAEFEAAHDLFHNALVEEQQIDESEAWFGAVEQQYIAGVGAAMSWLRTRVASESLDEASVQGAAGYVPLVQEGASVQEAADDVSVVQEEASVQGAADDSSIVQQGKLLSLLSIPKVELDRFGGDPLEYLSFMAVFDETIDSKTDDGQIKLTRLLPYTAGPAKAAIRNCALVGGDKGYKQAREILASRFGDNHLVSQRIIHDLKSGKAVSKGHEIQQLADDLSMAHTALKQMDMLAEVDTQLSILGILGRCPQFVCSRWRSKALDFKRVHKSYPKFENFVEFMKDIAADSCDPVYGREKTNVKSRGVEKSTCYNVVGEENENPDGPQTKFLFPCVVCKQSHRLFSCDQFKSMTPQDRFDVVVKHRLCFNCLLGGHRAYKCRKQSVCSVPGCGKKHTRFVHVDRAGDGDRGAVSNASWAGKMNVYLPVVPVVVNQKYKVYALLDSGSTNSFISRRLDRRLNLSGCSTPCSVTTLNSSSTFQSKLVSLELTSVDGTERLKLNNAIVVSNIPAGYPSKDLDTKLHPHLAGISVDTVARGTEVDILIGMDNARALMPVDLRSSTDRKEPYAVRTMFGWCLNGPVPGGHEGQAYANFVRLEQINDDLVNLWTLEKDLDDDSPAWSQDDRKVMEKWESEVKHENGHYHLPIPWKDEVPNLPNNRRTAVFRLHSLIKRLQKMGQLEKYEQKLLEMVEKGYAEEVPEGELELDNETVWYLPHHGVESASKPGKLRIVFYCAAKHDNVSLNSQCLQGPDLNNKLIHVLLRFRQFPIAFTSDVEAMYHQVKIPPSDRDCLRFLWVINGATKEYRMTSHLFGGIWCAASSTYALRRAVRDFPCSNLVSETVKGAFYVDDLLKSVQTSDEGMEIVKGTKEVLGQAGFNLTKFISNEPRLLKDIPEEDRATEVKDIMGNVQSSALGIRWNVSRDTFCYVGLASSEHPKEVTKRTMLSKVSSMYDPLGLIAPVVLQGKAVFQEAVRMHLGWDDPVPVELSNRWMAWTDSLNDLHQSEFARCVVPPGFEHSAIEIHHFADASLIGYGACSYVRAVNQVGRIHVALLTAKARLAPIKSTTIPRLELCAAVAAVKLDKVIRRQFTVQLQESSFWSDSNIVLSYIKNTSRRFKVFVSNRVNFILDNSTRDQWNHIAGELNPADVASRGCLGSELPDVWISGPEVLYQYKCNWLRPTMEMPVDDDDAEVKVCLAASSQKRPLCEEVVSAGPTHPLDKLINHHSSFYKLKRAVAALTRVRGWLSRRTGGISQEPISVDEMGHAEKLMIRHVQKETYQEEIVSLLQRHRVTRSSSLRDLSPTLCDGIIVVGSRIKHAMVPTRVKHPIILPLKHRLSRLILMDSHNEAHLGTEWTLSRVRRKFWIPRARSFLKKIKKDCITCRKLYAKPMEQKMADLPPERCQVDKPPFAYVGLDLFGPFHVSYGRASIKRYGCVFTCFVTRAVHLEVLFSLETDSFINGFVRFSSRRGSPLKVWSDNGTNIVGAHSEMSRNLQKLDRNRIMEAARRRNVKWIFNPPYASHQGGVWERIIRTIRRVLMAVLQCSSRLTDEVLHTTFCEVENIINSRPLTKCSDDVNDESPLTPNHFLLMQDNAALSRGIFHKGDLYQKRWRCVQYLADTFWKRWMREYIPLLHMRKKKWHEEKDNLQVGELVLVVNENVPRGLWPLGLVLDATVGRDGLVRSARLRTLSGEVVRPITKLVRLEGSPQNPSFDI